MTHIAPSTDYRQALNAITQRIERAQLKAVLAVDAKGGASAC